MEADTTHDAASKQHDGQPASNHRYFEAVIIDPEAPDNQRLQELLPLLFPGRTVKVDLRFGEAWNERELATMLSANAISQAAPTEESRAMLLSAVAANALEGIKRATPDSAKDVQDMNLQDFFEAMICMFPSAYKRALKNTQQEKGPGDKGKDVNHSQANITPNHPDGTDRMSWKFSPDIQVHLDKYFLDFVPEPNLPTDDTTNFCTCGVVEDGRTMIECSNNDVKACLTGWFHVECMGMNENTIPGEDDEWYCERCSTLKVGRLRENAPGHPRIKNTGLVAAVFSEVYLDLTRQKEEKAAIETSKGGRREGGKALSVNTELAFLHNTSSPTTSPLQASSPLGNSLADAVASKDYDLGEIASSSKVEVQKSGGRKMSSKAALKSPRTWSKEEEEHLIAVVTELTSMGVSGEQVWVAARPMMRARGYDRTFGGMKMQWIRGLRERSGIDERRPKGV